MIEKSGGIFMIYKYYSDTNEYAINNFRNNVVCFSHVEQFNDKREFNAKFQDEIKLPYSDVEFIEEQIILQKLRIRICCFSIDKNSDHMWKSYANSDKGFCLGYDENELKNSNIILKPVVYYDEVPVLCYKEGKDNGEELFLSQVCHKKVEWSNEQEVRAILFVQPFEMIQLQSEEELGKDKEEYDCKLVPKLDIFEPHNSLKLYRAVKKNILINLEPKELIIGMRCSENYCKELKQIADEKGIRIIERKRSGL